MEGVDLGEPTSFLHHVYLGCPQRECQIRKDIVDNCKSMFESRFSAGAVEKLPEARAQGNLRHPLCVHGPMTWKVMQRNAWKDIANLRSKQPSSCINSQRHAWMTIILQRKSIGWRIIYCLLTHCSEMSLFGSYLLARYLWSVNKLARAVTKWTKSCDKRLARLISYIHHTCEFRQ